MDWKPIETAPRDGTEILIAGGVFWSDSGWREERPLSGVTLAWWYSRATDGWCLGNDEAHDEFKWAKPTHWMPLPPPPTPSAESASAARGEGG